MSRIIKGICDGCGKEIEKDPIRIHMEHVEVETGDFITDEGGNYYWENDRKDYCENCAKQIIQFVNGLPARNAGKPAVPNPEFEKLFNPPTTAKMTEGKTEKKPTIKELLKAGKTVEEIVQATGCTRTSVSQVKYQMKKEREDESAEQVSVPADSNPKAVMCSKAIKTCEYAGKTGSQLTCDYAIIVGHSRGCPPEQCTAYRRKKGK